MESKDEQEKTLRLLVQHVSRAFYSPRHIIILDLLARYPVLKDDDLAGRMGLQSKELNQLMAVLSDDGLVQIYHQNELQKGARRAVARQYYYYYIDYRRFVNVVKWRIIKMRSTIINSINSRNDLDNKGYCYICPQCGQSYPALDVFLECMGDCRDDALPFICQNCQVELLLMDSSGGTEGVIEGNGVDWGRMQRFNEQMRFVIQGLQKSEAMVIPAFDVSSWVDNNNNNLRSGADKQAKTEREQEQEQEEIEAGDNGIGVVMLMDGGELDELESTTGKRKRKLEAEVEAEAEAAAKRQQNVLPMWFSQSTISGDWTG